MQDVLVECVDPRKEIRLRALKMDGLSVANTGGPRVYVLADRCANRVWEMLPDMVRKQPKNAARQPAQVFATLKPGQCGIYRREFKSASQLRRSVRTLLDRLLDREADVTCFIQVPNPVFKNLLDDAEPHTSASAKAAPRSGTKGTVAMVRDVLRSATVPDFVREAYVGDAECIERVRQMIWCVSESTEPVLIVGESGTGKEIVARCIHECSVARGRGPVFNAINCSAVQSQLFESELFGHKKGSFTGAYRSRVGLWKAAGNGTLFLDEVADMEPANQAKMLRALENKAVRPVGSDESDVKVSARVVSATNRDLHSMTLYGAFRHDLYHRLSTFRIVVPPLRDHMEDIGVLAQFLWKKVRGQDARPLPEAAIEALAERSWPANVRELHNVISIMRTVGKGKVDSRAQAEMAILIHENPASIFSDDGTESLSANDRLSATIRQLKAADRALDDAQNFFSASGGFQDIVRKQNPPLLMALEDRRRELADLTRAPLLLGTAECFDAVHEAAGKIAFLLDSLHADPGSVSTRDQRNVNKAIAHARNLVTSQMEATLAQVRS